MNLPHEHVIGGSPLYLVGPEHVAAVIALGVLAVGAWLFRTWLFPRSAHVLAPIDHLLLALLAGSAAVHVGLAIGHDHGTGIRALFLADAFLLAIVARRVLSGSPAGRLG